MKNKIALLSITKIYSRVKLNSLILSTRKKQIFNLSKSKCLHKYILHLINISYVKRDIKKVIKQPKSDRILTKIRTFIFFPFPAFFSTLFI